MPETFQTGELKFECARCSGCCGGGPGYVWISRRDASRILSFLSLDFPRFFDLYCRLAETAAGLALTLRERRDFSCVFLGPDGCSIYPARPAQCRTYPFWESVIAGRDSWRNESAYCPGIGKGRALHADEIAARLRDRELNPPLVFLPGEDPRAAAVEADDPSPDSGEPGDAGKPVREALR